jgi:flavin-dependent dehydrogenase
VHVQEVGGEATRTLRAGYFVDASGRRGLLRHKLGLGQRSPHSANAAWWRVKGIVDLKDLVPESETAWHARDPEHIRWYSTVHFMGTGYWFWYIPLAPGEDGVAHTSLGIVVHDEVHPFDTVRTLERALAWVKKPTSRGATSSSRTWPAEDFLCLRNYSHECKRCFSAALVAGRRGGQVLADPFYSPGSDFIALGNTFTTEIVKARLRGGDVAQLVARYERSYKGFFDTRDRRSTGKAAPVYGQPAGAGRQALLGRLQRTGRSSASTSSAGFITSRRRCTSRSRSWRASSATCSGGSRSCWRSGRGATRSRRRRCTSSCR